MPESAAQQDDIIRGIAATEEELAQQEGVVVSDPSDLTPFARVLEAIMRRALLPRWGIERA